MQEHFARNIIVGFARLGGRSVGIVAQQPMVLAGVLDINSADKAARFVRFCDCFNIPIVTFVDVPGFLPGVAPGARRHHPPRRQAAVRLLRGHRAQNHRDHAQGLRRRLRRYVSKHVRGDINYAWPTAEIAVMGVDGAVNIIFKDQIEQSRRPGGHARPSWWPSTRQKFANPYVAAGARLHRRRDRAAHTRPRLITALEMLQNKRDTNPPKKHGNIPSMIQHRNH